MTDVKEIYTQKAPVKGNSKTAVFRLGIVLVITCICLYASGFIYYQGIVTVAVMGAAAYFVYRILAGTVFEITYALYDDRLVFMRKYGTLSWECEVFPLDEAKFFENRIEHRGKSYDFFPSDELKGLLNV